MVKVSKVKNMQPMYGLYKKKFTRPSMYMQEDILDIAKAIAESEDDIKNGRVYDGEEILKGLRMEYGY